MATNHERKMKQLKDYLHFYIGQQVFLTLPLASSSEATLTGVIGKRTDGEVKLRIQLSEKGDGIIWCDEDEIQLILRSLSDMTENEAWELAGGKSTLYDDVSISKIDKTGIEISYVIKDEEGTPHEQFHKIDFYAFTPKTFLWLTSRGFDLFGLIEQGLAFDFAKVKD